MSVDGKQILAAIIVIFVANYAESQCADETPCTCIRSDGMGFNLGALAAGGPFINENGSVAFQPCTNTNLTILHSQPSNATADCEKTSLCWWSDDKFVNLGSIEETHWRWTQKNPELILSHGSHESEIELICSNSGSKTVLTLLNTTSTALRLQLSSDKVCITHMRSEGLSKGSVLVILFFVFSGVYFIGGAILLICFRGAVGKEVIPNYDFWADIPGLVRDGVAFTFSGCSAVSYERI